MRRPTPMTDTQTERSVDVSDSHTQFVTAPTGASSGQRSVDVSDSPIPSAAALGVHVECRGEAGSVFVAPSSADVNPGQRITRAHTDERGGQQTLFCERRGRCTDPVAPLIPGASSGRRERSGETASANDPRQRLNPPASQTARLAARRGGRPTLMSSRSSGSTLGQSYRDSISALAGHARSTAESIARLMAPSRQRLQPRS